VPRRGAASDPDQDAAQRRARPSLLLGELHPLRGLDADAVTRPEPERAMTMTTWKKVLLGAAAAAIALAVQGGPTASEAEAGPRHRLGAPAKKKSKKELAIERHMFTAQYYLLRENNSKAAARELNKVLRLDRNHL